MAYLVAPLVRLRKEIDRHWPHRDRRTDGWLAWPWQRISYGHNPDPAGRVHAIDVDRDGIDPPWIIRNIRKTGTGLWYIIWADTIWSASWGWTPRPYRGASRHLDHMHFEVRHTTLGRTYPGGWGIFPYASQTMGDAPPSTSEWGNADAYGEMRKAADYAISGGDSAYGYGGLMAGLRR